MPSVQISLSNVFTMRPVQPITPGHLDSDWQRERLLPGQVDAIYLQKVKRGMRQRFMFDATDNTSISLRVIDCKGKTVFTFAPAITVDVPGNISLDGSQLHSYLYKAADFSTITENGEYYLLLTVNFTNSIYQSISEPFYLANEHAGTLEIVYQNNGNKDAIWYENLPVRLPLLVEGKITRLVMGGETTVYRDQNQDITVLSSDTYRTWTLGIGKTGEGIPDYMLDKLSRVFDCDFVLLNGKQYTKSSESATFEKEGDEDAALYAANLSIQEADGDEGAVYNDPRILLYMAPAFPYAVSQVEVVQGSLISSLKPANVDGYVLDDTTEEASMIAAINADIAAKELYGSVVKIGAGVYYENGPGENFRNGFATIYTTQFGFNFLSAGPIGSGPGAIYPALSIDFQRGAGLIEYGDGTVTAIPAGAPGVTRSLTHSYIGPAGSYSVRLFGSMYYFATQAPERSGLTGQIPAGIEVFSLRNGVFPANTFDFSVFNTARLKLRSLFIVNAGLTSANGFNNIYFPALRTIDFSGNAFSSTVMGNFTYDVHYNASNRNTNSPIIVGGTFSIGGQTTGASLNAKGTTYKNLLTNAPFYWTVNA